MDSLEGDFDVIVLGTGLTESITAAALAKAGLKVAHLDVNQYYGQEEASLSLDELAEWIDARKAEDVPTTSALFESQARFTSVSRSSVIPKFARQYAVSLAPSVIPSVGPFIEALVASGVSRYGGFRLLDCVGIYDSATSSVKNVPGSKEDVFKDKGIKLVDKSRLMRFLRFAAGEFEGSKEIEGKEQMPFFEYLQEAFSINTEMAAAIAFSLAYCVSPQDTTLPALTRLRRYLRSSGRYGTSPFLVGHYGGLGEIAQGFCRTAAVSGTVYILGRSIQSIDRSHDAPSRYKVTLEDFPEPLTSDIIIASPDHVLPNYKDRVTRVSPSDRYTYAGISAVARCVAVLDTPIEFSRAPEGVQVEETSAVDTATLIFPPGSMSGQTTTTTVLITGSGSMSAPQGKYILYISSPLSTTEGVNPKAILQPYLNVVLRLCKGTDVKPLFTAFYIQHLALPPLTSTTLDPSFIVTPEPVALHSDSADSAAKNAEAIFWKAIEALKTSSRADTRGFDLGEVDSAWPVLEADSSESVEEDW